VTALRQRMMEDLQIRNYAPATVRAYIRGVADFAKHFGKSPDQLGAEQIREYQLFLIQEKGVALPTYIQIVSGLRFLYTNTLHRQVGIERIPFPRYEKKLPVILSREEVKALLEAPKNLGHRTILTTMYAAGPRISEVAHLKVSDIDSGRHVIWIRGGKGRKDRQTLLPPKLLELIPASDNRHQFAGHRVVKRSVLGGLHHEYRLVKEAAERRLLFLWTTRASAA